MKFYFLNARAIIVHMYFKSQAVFYIFLFFIYNLFIYNFFLSDQNMNVLKKGIVGALLPTFVHFEYADSASDVCK